MKRLRSMMVLRRFGLRRGLRVAARWQRAPSLIWRSRTCSLVLMPARSTMIPPIYRGSSHLDFRLRLDLKLSRARPLWIGTPTAPTFVHRQSRVALPATRPTRADHGAELRHHMHHHRSQLRFLRRRTRTALHSERHDFRREDRVFASSVVVLQRPGRWPSNAPGPRTNSRLTSTFREHVETTRLIRQISERLSWRTPHVPAATAPSAPRAATALRPTALIWRTEPTPELLAPFTGGMSAFAAAAPLASARAVSRDELQQTRTPPADRSAEPALIDRVATEVIGRVERRFRIERERRGA